MVKQPPTMSQWLSQSKIITITSVTVENHLKTFRGLNSHKRSCHVLDIPDLKSLYEVSLQGTSDDIEESNEEDEEIDLDKLSLLTGVKLPKRDSDWQIATDYFKIMVEPETLPNENINTYVLRLQETIHSYFKEQYGNLGDTQSHELYQRYGSGTESKLKKNLRDLKKSYQTNQNDILLNEIKSVSKVLREKFWKRSNSFESFDHNKRSKENLWKYCKDIFEKESKIQPEFCQDGCHSYFRNTLKAKNRNRKFTYPPWMKQLSAPNVSFDNEPPTYKEIMKMIMKMKSSGSPCPLDQISVIVLKRCPILRTYVWKIVKFCGKISIFQQCGKTVLLCLFTRS